LWYWESFLNLDSERLRDYGLIPWSAMNRYCREYDVMNEEKESFMTTIKEMDKIYLTEQSKKLEKQQQK